MNAIAFDTHHLIKKLIASGMPEAQAETVVETVKNARVSEMPELATKLDIADLRREVADVKTDMIRWLVPLLLGQAALVTALVKLLQ
ncbi:MAG: hypothetical protein ACWA40_01010 [Planktomarina sp.]